MVAVECFKLLQYDFGFRHACAFHIVCVLFNHGQIVYVGKRSIILVRQLGEHPLVFLLKFLYSELTGTRMRCGNDHIR